MMDISMECNQVSDDASTRAMPLALARKPYLGYVRSDCLLVDNMPMAYMHVT